VLGTEAKGVWRCVAVCCSVLQCVAACCSVWQCVAVCCSVLATETKVACRCICIHNERYSEREKDER